MSLEDACLRIILGAQKAVLTALFCINEDDVRTIMKQEYVFTSSDQSTNMRNSTSRKLGNHPRNYGSFARKIGKYVLVNGVIELSEGKLTGEKGGIPLIRSR
jgi:N-acyl-D-amino-acid deacylase